MLLRQAVGSRWLRCKMLSLSPLPVPRRLSFSLPPSFRRARKTCNLQGAGCAADSDYKSISSATTLYVALHNLSRSEHKSLVVKSESQLYLLRCHDYEPPSTACQAALPLLKKFTLFRVFTIPLFFRKLLCSRWLSYIPVGKDRADCETKRENAAAGAA